MTELGGFVHDQLHGRVGQGAAGGDGAWQSVMEGHGAVWVHAGR